MIGKCVYLKESFTPGSEEHVLQAALGARWKNGDFISPKANAKFSVMDAQLIETVHPFRVLLGAEGQYGPGSPLKNIPDKEGRKYRVESGGDISLSEPFVEVESLPDGSTKIHAQIANSSQAQWAAAKIVTLAEQANPGKTLCQKSLAEAIHQQGEKVRARLTSPLHFQLKLGGLDALRAITKSAFNLLAVSAPHLAIKDCFDPVRRFILDGDGNMEDFIRWGTGDALNQLVLAQSITFWQFGLTEMECGDTVSFTEHYCTRLSSAVRMWGRNLLSATWLILCVKQNLPSIAT